MEIKTTLRLDREANNTVRYVETTFPQRVTIATRAKLAAVK